MTTRQSESPASFFSCAAGRDHPINTRLKTCFSSADPEIPFPHAFARASPNFTPRKQRGSLLSPRGGCRRQQWRWDVLSRPRSTKPQQQQPQHRQQQRRQHETARATIGDGGSEETRTSARATALSTNSERRISIGESTADSVRAQTSREPPRTT